MYHNFFCKMSHQLDFNLIIIISHSQGVTFPAGLWVLPAGNLGISQEIQPKCPVVPSKNVTHRKPQIKRRTGKSPSDTQYCASTLFLNLN